MYFTPHNIETPYSLSVSLSLCVVAFVVHSTLLVRLNGLLFRSEKCHHFGCKRGCVLECVLFEKLHFTGSPQPNHKISSHLHILVTRRANSFGFTSL